MCTIDSFLFPLRIFDRFIPQQLIFSVREDTATFIAYAGLNEDGEFIIEPYHFYVDMNGAEQLIELITKHFPEEGEAIQTDFDAELNKEYVESPTSLDLSEYLFKDGEWKMLSDIIILCRETVSIEVEDEEEEDGESWKRLLNEEEGVKEEEFDDGLTVEEIVEHTYDKHYSTFLKYPGNAKKGVGHLGIELELKKYCTKASYYHQILNPDYFPDRFEPYSEPVDELELGLGASSTPEPQINYKADEVKSALGLCVEHPFEQKIIDTILEDYYQAMIIGNHLS